MPKSPKPMPSPKPKEPAAPLRQLPAATQKPSGGHQTFKEVFPPDESYRQIEYRTGESDKVFGNESVYYLVSLDLGAMLAVWELIEAEASRKWGNSLASHKALVRGVQAFRESYRAGISSAV